MESPVLAAVPSRTDQWRMEEGFRLVTHGEGWAGILRLGAIRVSVPWEESAGIWRLTDRGCIGAEGGDPFKDPLKSGPYRVENLKVLWTILPPTPTLNFRQGGWW